jgi:hypothetical protein
MASGSCSSLADLIALRAESMASATASSATVIWIVMASERYAEV